MWDTTVGFVRETFGDLEHYRELSYEELRKDPGDALRPVFEWLGVSADEDVLETIRLLSQQQFSDLRRGPRQRPEGAAAESARSCLERA